MVEKRLRKVNLQTMMKIRGMNQGVEKRMTSLRRKRILRKRIPRKKIRMRTHLISIRL
jgi:hypothetical protein